MFLSPQVGRDQEQRDFSSRHWCREDWPASRVIPCHLLVLVLLLLLEMRLAPPAFAECIKSLEGTIVSSTLNDTRLSCRLKWLSSIRTEIMSGWKKHVGPSVSSTKRVSLGTWQRRKGNLLSHSCSGKRNETIRQDSELILSQSGWKRALTQFTWYSQFVLMIQIRMINVKKKFFQWIELIRMSIEKTIRQVFFAASLGHASLTSLPLMHLASPFSSH